jgi:hypothetical protein
MARRRDRNHSPQKNSVQDSWKNKDNGYPFQTSTKQ